MNNRQGSQGLLGEVRMVRIRVATAECKLKVLREEARQAKRRRKEAKRIAQQARKQLKRFKADVVELRRALAEAEAKLFASGGRALIRKVAKGRPAAKTGARATKKATIRARQPRSAALLSPRRPTRKPSALKRTPSVSQGRANAAAPESKELVPQTSNTNANTYEQGILAQGPQEVEDQEV